MTVISIPDIYGRWYLINFDSVKLIGLSDNDKNGDLMVAFTDQSKEWITVGCDRLSAVSVLEHLCEELGASGWIPQLPESGDSDHE